jgi:hypothetical protein
MQIDNNLIQMNNTLTEQILVDAQKLGTELAEKLIKVNAAQQIDQSQLDYIGTIIDFYIWESSDIWIFYILVILDFSEFHVSRIHMFDNSAFISIPLNPYNKNHRKTGEYHLGRLVGIETTLSALEEPDSVNRAKEGKMDTISNSKVS